MIRLNRKNGLWAGGVAAAGLSIMGLMGATFAQTTPSGTVSTETTPSRTITVLGVAEQSGGSGGGQVTANVNLSAHGASADAALGQVQSEEAGVAKALEGIGVTAQDITVSNQSVNVNGGPPGSQPMKPVPAPGNGSGINYNANENVQVNLSPSQEGKALDTIVKALASSQNSFNVWVNTNNPPTGNGTANAATIGQAMDAASAEAQAVAAKMGATLGSVQSVKQVPYQGPYSQPNMTVVELQVVYGVN